MTGSVAARLLVLLLPIACVGLFARVLYTPDEPREASLVVAMASQADKSLPELAGRPFVEKPPLLYWLGGAAVAALGPSPAATRLPNLVTCCSRRLRSHRSSRARRDRRRASRRVRWWRPRCSSTKC